MKMDQEVIEQCVHLAEEGKITFPEVVRKLLGAGIELYYVDFLSSRATYYGKNDTYTIDCSYTSKAEVAQNFDKEKVVGGIRQIQSGQIDYQEFVRRMKEAGVITYLAFIQGGKVAYFGRKGEQHVEEFPKK